MGALCGYVGTNKEYVSFNSKYDNFIVHGGVTFVGNDLEGMNQDMGYIGFDCSHAMDLVPQFSEFVSSCFILTSDFATYKNIDFVKENIESLVKQFIDYELNYEYLADELIDGEG